MVLGASTAQLPIISKAIEMGCYVITVDNIPENIGHTYSHQCVNCSTVDQQEVCKIAQQLKIDGIVTFASDIAVSTVAFVAEALNLTGCSPLQAGTLSNKASFRAFQQQHQLNHPDFLITNSPDFLLQKNWVIQPPLLFKPIDTSGSRGITKVADTDVDNALKAFSYAQQFSRSGMVSIESFIDGVDVSGDGFLVDGQLVAVVSQKYKQGFIPVGHSFPSNLSIVEQACIFDEITKTCKTIGYQNGPIDFDVKIYNSVATVIEMSPRLGGNGIPELIRHYSGIDLIEMTLNYALGKSSVLPCESSKTNACGSWMFGSKIAGKIKSMTDAKEMYPQISELIGFQANYKVGDQVDKFEHSGNGLGYGLFSIPDGISYSEMVVRLEAALQLDVSTDLIEPV